MKNKFSALLVALLTFGFATTSFAQYDDLYSIPSDDTEVTQYEAEEEYVAYEEATEDYDEYDEYSYLDDQDYYYSSRIRRFNSSNAGFGYYSPFYTDAAYYNAAFSPGVSIYAGNPFSYNAYRRAARNQFSGYGFNSAYSLNPFNRGFGFGNGFGNRFNSFNSFNRFGAASAFNAYCPPTSYGNNLVRTPRGANNATYGPRGTSANNSRSNDSSVRRGTSRIIRSAQSGDRAGSSRSRSTSTRANTNTRTNSRTYNRSNRTNRNYNSTRSNNSNRRSYSTPRSNNSNRRSYSTPKRSNSKKWVE